MTSFVTIIRRKYQKSPLLFLIQSLYSKYLLLLLLLTDLQVDAHPTHENKATHKIEFFTQQQKAVLSIIKNQ